MITPQELRIGNYLNHVVDGLVIVEKIDSTNVLMAKDGKTVHRKGSATCRIINNELLSIDDSRGMWMDFLQPISLNDEWLIKFGFEKIEKPSNINGYDYLLQVRGDGRDGTWMSGIGTISYERTGDLVVCVLCRGNYVCGNLEYIHQLQNLYYSLANKELKLPEP